MVDRQVVERYETPENKRCQSEIKPFFLLEQFWTFFWFYWVQCARVMTKFLTNDENLARGSNRASQKFGDQFYVFEFFFAVYRQIGERRATRISNQYLAHSGYLGATD